MTDLEKELVEAAEALICHVCNNRIGWKRQGWFTGRACAGCDGIRAALAHAHEVAELEQAARLQLQPNAKRVSLNG